MNNSSFTNVILVIILVLLVGFGVWYVTGRTAPAGDREGSSIDLNIRGGSQGGASDDGTSDQGPGDR